MEKSKENSSRNFLKKILQKKIDNNSLYSSRALARDLGISPAYISQILSGKKHINLGRALEISNLLGLLEEERLMFLEAVIAEEGADVRLRSRVNYNSLCDLSMEQFLVIAEWKHYAIMDLTTTSNFNSNVDWIGKRLGIPKLEVELAIRRLIKVGLLSKENGILKKTYKQVRFPTQVSMESVREHHRQMMERAKLQLDRQDEKSFQQRMICSITCAADSARVEEAKKRVLEFQQELANFLSTSDNCQEVYQINIQLFPHSKEVNNA